MMPRPQADARNNLLLLLGLLFIAASFHDYYGVLKTKGEFGLIDFVLLLIGFNMLIATKRINRLFHLPLLFLLSIIIPFCAPVKIDKFPYELKLLYFALSTSSGLHVCIIKKKEVLFLSKKFAYYTNRFESLLEKKEAEVSLIFILLLSGVAVYQLASNVDISTGADFWWHYINTKTIYETGMPVSDTGIFDKKFLVYPFFSHFFAASVSKVTGSSIIGTLSYLSYLILLITGVIIYRYSSKMSCRWCAIVSLAGFMFLYVPLTDIPSGRFAQLFGTMFGLLSLLQFSEYERSEKKRHLVASAISAAIAFSSHWIIGMITTITYFVYILRYHGTGTLFYFFSVFLLFSQPYLFFLIKNSPMIFNIDPLYTGDAKELFLLHNHLGNLYQVVHNIQFRLSTVGGVLLLIGITANFRSEKKRLTLTFLACTTLLLVVGYAYPVLYFARFFDYVILSLIFFIGDGATFLMLKVRQYYKPATGMIARYLFTLLFLAYLTPLMSANLTPTSTALNNSDRAAVSWVKENLGREEVVATNVRLTKSVYGFTKVRPTHPSEFARLIKNIYDERNPNYDGFILINSGCGFQISPTNQDFEGSTPNILLLKEVPCDKLLERMKQKFETFFEVETTLIFRAR